MNFILSEAFSTWTVFHCLEVVLKHLYHSEVKRHTQGAASFYSLLRLPLAIINVHPISQDLSLLDSMHEWGLLCLASFTRCNDLVVTHTVVCTSTSFLWRNSSPLHTYTHNLFIHSSTDGHGVIPSVVMNSALSGQVFGAASSSILLTSSIIPLFK